MSAVLELRALECVRGDRPLFSGVSARVRSGQLLWVRGANGAGKTSLLRMVCGLAAPSRGEILWLGRPVSQVREAFNTQQVYLGHGAALKDDLSALENLQAAGGLAGLECNKDDAARALASAGLRGCEHVPARALSQGQRQRAVLARLVLSSAVALWVLDEPFNALDSGAAQWLQRLIGAQLGRGGVVVLTSHEDLPQGVAPDPLTITL